ncbi:MAG: LssY C-terminal domain-containing protein [Deltaproteobacteria bacterium]|nr:LssY C-terminal domain-containing protein [Deltaproteobacteria bacterium]
MVVRRAGSAVPAVPAKPVAPRTPPAPRASPAARPAVGGDSFQAARTAKVALGDAGPPPFVKPAQGEWTLDTQGNRSDPVTMYVHGSLSQVEQALSQSGWTQADPAGLAANVRYVGAAAKEEVGKALSWAAQKVDGLATGIAGAFGIHLHPWTTPKPPDVPGVNKMPVSVQSYRGQKLVAAYEMNNDPLGGRDHLRIFATGQKDAQGNDVYAIAASRDTGIVFAPNHPESAFLFHAVQPDVGSERDLVLKNLQSTGSVSNVKTFNASYGAPSGIGEYVGDSKGYELTLG